MATKEKWAKVFHTFHQYKDNIPIYFGDDKDANIDWNTSNSALTFTGATDFTGAMAIEGAVTVTGGVTWTGAVDVVLTAPTTADDAFYGLINASAAYTADNMVGVRGKVVLSGTTNFVSATGVWAGLDFSSKTGSGSGLTCAINAEVTSDNATRPNAIIYIQSLPTGTANFANVPYIAFTEYVAAGTGSNYLFSLGHQPAGSGRNVTSGDGKLLDTTTIKIMANGTDMFIPLSTVKNAITTTAVITTTNATPTSSTSTGAIIATGGIATAADITCGDDLFMASSGAVINFNSSNVTLTHSAGALTLNSTSKLQFRDSGSYIYSGQPNRIYIMVSDTTASAIHLGTGAGGGVNVNAYLRLKQTTSDGDTEGQIWYDTSVNKIKYWFPNVARTVADLNTAQTFTNHQTISSDNKLYFRDTNAYISSSVANRLYIYASDTTASAITLTTGASGGVNVNAYLRLMQTTVNGNTKGQMWYDTSVNKIKYWVPDVIRTVVDTQTAQTFTASLTFSEDNGIYFRDSGIYISSLVAGRLYIQASDTTASAITLTTGAGGGVNVNAYLRLKQTDTPASTAGQLWFDTGDDKVHYWDGSAELTVLDLSGGTLTGALNLTYGDAKVFDITTTNTTSTACIAASITATDSGATSTGRGIGLFVDCVCSGTKSSTYGWRSFRLNTQITQNVPSVQVADWYMHVIDNKTITHLDGLAIYWETFGSAIGNACMINLGMNSNNTTVERHCFIKCREHHTVQANSTVIRLEGQNAASYLLWLDAGNANLFVDSSSTGGHTESIVIRDEANSRDRYIYVYDS